MRRVLARISARGWAALAAAAAIAAGGAAVGWSHRHAARLLARGEGALAARDYPAARAALDEYVRIRPADPRGHLLAARAARRLREYYDAREHLRLCREAGGDADQVDVEAALLDVQRGDDGPIDWLRGRADSDDDQALAVLEVLIQHDLNTSQLWQALDGLNRYLSRRPDDLHARLGRASVWERMFYFREAVDDYRAAVAAHPDNDPARLKLADALLVTGPPAAALEEYRRVATRWPDRPDVRLGLARAHRQLGEADPARALLDRLLAETPGHPEALWERGQLALDAGNVAEAEPLLARAAALLPYDRRVHFALYQCLLARGRGAEAEVVNARVARLDADVRRIDQLRQELMKRPKDAGLWYEGGLLFLRNGERPAGVRWLRAAVRLDPEHELARRALAEADTTPSR